MPSIGGPGALSEGCPRVPRTLAGDSGSVSRLKSESARSFALSLFSCCKSLVFPSLFLPDATHSSQNQSSSASIMSSSSSSVMPTHEL